MSTVPSDRRVRKEDHRGHERQRAKAGRRVLGGARVPRARPNGRKRSSWERTCIRRSSASVSDTRPSASRSTPTRTSFRTCRRKPPGRSTRYSLTEPKLPRFESLDGEGMGKGWGRQAVERSRRRWGSALSACCGRRHPRRGEGRGPVASPVFKTCRQPRPFKLLTHLA